MAKENVIIFDGEDKFIKPKKHVYSKTKGKAEYANAVGALATSTNPDENVVASDVRAIKSTIVPSTTTSSTTSESVAPITTFIPKGSVEDVGTAADRKLALIEQRAAEAAAAAAKVFDDTTGVRGPGIAAGLVAQPNSSGGRITEPIQNILTPNPALLTDAQRKAVEEGRASVTLTDTPRSKDSVPICGYGLVYDAISNQCIPGSKVDVGAGQPTAGTEGSNVVATRESGILATTSTTTSTTTIGGSMYCEAGYYYDIPSGMCMKTPTQGHAPCPSGYLWDDTLGQCVETSGTITTTTTTTTTTQSPSNQVDVNIPIGLGTAPTIGGTSGGGGGSAFPDETPKAVAPKKSYFWYYVAAAGLAYYLYKKYKK
jgi:hypothetical protein